MEIFYQVICENQDNVAWCFVHAANPFVVLTILVLTPKMPKTRCFLALKDLYYIPVFGLSKIFCIFCLGELVCWHPCKLQQLSRPIIVLYCSSPILFVTSRVSHSHVVDTLGANSSTCKRFHFLATACIYYLVHRIDQPGSQSTKFSPLCLVSLPLPGPICLSASNVPWTYRGRFSASVADLQTYLELCPLRLNPV